MWFPRLISFLPARSVGQSRAENSADPLVRGMEVEKHPRVAWVWPCVKRKLITLRKLKAFFLYLPLLLASS